MAKATITAAEALTRLQEGNERYARGVAQHPHADQARRQFTSQEGQAPFATVVACSDSRVPVEHLFDQGIGDLFVIRVAGNVCNVDEIASIEYAVEHLGTPLCVILGHSQCGAVTAAASGAAFGGSVCHLINAIQGAVDRAKTKHPDLAGDELVASAIRENTWLAIENLLRGSPGVRQRTASGQLDVVAAQYDLMDGTVAWMGSHPTQAALLSLAE